jgi:trehalose 2-sulfotransferase
MAIPVLLSQTLLARKGTPVSGVQSFSKKMMAELAARWRTSRTDAMFRMMHVLRWPVAVSDGLGQCAPRGYAICTAPRSGSNWLGQLLQSTGVLGTPLEYFNGPARRILDDPTYPDDPNRQVERVLTMGRTPNGVYALKIFANQFRAIESHIRLTRALPNLRFVFLRRRDVLGQAISWSRALQTNQYRSTQPVSGPATYDRGAIAERLRVIVEEYALWQSYFARNGLSPIEVTYEDLPHTAQVLCRKLAKLLGVKGKVVIQPKLIDLVIQRDDQSEQWRRRFVEEEGNPDRL